MSRFLFVVQNGVGFGHLRRAILISRELMHQRQIIEFRKYDSLLKQLEVRVVQAKSIC